MDHKLIQARKNLMRSLVQTSAPAVRSSSGLRSFRSSKLPMMQTAWLSQATCAPIQLSVLRMKTLYPCNQCELLSFWLVSIVSWHSTTEKSLQWCHSFSEKKALLTLLALLFICFALWFRLLFQILTLLTAFAKNSNITKSEWKWKTNLRIKLGWKAHPCDHIKLSLMCHGDGSTSALITAFPDIEEASLYIGATWEPIIHADYKIGQKSKIHAGANLWGMQSASFQNQRVLSRMSITVNMHCFLGPEAIALSGSSRLLCTSKDSNPKQQQHPYRPYCYSVPNYPVPVMQKAS